MKKYINLLNTETIRYVIIGACTTLVNFISFFILFKLFLIDLTLSNIISIVISILFAYITNKKIVFQSKCRNFYELFFEIMKFIGTRFLTMMIEVIGVDFLVNIVRQDELISKFIIQIFVFMSNYVISKMFIFTKKE